MLFYSYQPTKIKNFKKNTHCKFIMKFDITNGFDIHI